MSRFTDLLTGVERDTPYSAPVQPQTIVQPQQRQPSIAATQEEPNGQLAASNPFLDDQFGSDVTPRASAPRAPETSEVNPFMDAPAPAPAPAPAQPQAAPAPVHSGNIQADPLTAQRMRKYQSDIAALINSGASREQIMAAVDEFRKTDPNAGIAGLDEALAWREKNAGREIGVGMQLSQDQAVAKKDYHGEDQGALEAAGMGARDSLLLGAWDEADAVLDATRNSVGNIVGLGDGQSWSENYAQERDANRQALNDAEYYHSGAYLGGQVAGGLATALVGSGEAALAKGGWSAAGRLAAEGAGYGGVYGFNSATGDISDRLVEGGKGAALGAVGGVALGMPANAIARRIMPSGQNAGREILDAADRLNAGARSPDQMIRPLPGHVSDGGVASFATGLMQPTLIGGMASGLRGATHDFEISAGNVARRIADDAAGGTSNTIENVAARTNDPRVPGSLGAYAEESETAARTIYRAAENAAGAARVPTPATITRIDEILKRWAEVPGGVAGAEKLAALRAQLANGPNGKSTSAAWTIEGLRRLRTSFGDNIEANQRELKEQAKLIWGPLSMDIFRGLRAAKLPDAAKLFREADKKWAQRVENVGVISRIIGKDQDLSADQVAQRLTNMGAKDYDYLGRAMRAVDPQQAADIRGGLINSLGKPSASRMMHASDNFSIESFATRRNQLSGQAKNATFGASTIRDLDDLAKLAGTKRAIDQYGNPSKSGIYMENWNQSAKIVDGVAGVAGIGAAAATMSVNPMAIVALGSMLGGGLLLGTPRVARMLVRLTEDRFAGGRLPKWASRTIAEASRRYPAAAQNLAQLRDTLEGRTDPGITLGSDNSNNRQPLPSEAFTLDDAPATSSEDTRQPLPDETFTLD